MVHPHDEFLSVLNSRSQEIFRRLVERYLDTGLPVGSRDLSRLLQTELSPASVRNVMADLEDLGLIAAPHTSAGRQPTQQGLRFSSIPCSKSARSMKAKSVALPSTLRAMRGGGRWKTCLRKPVRCFLG